MKAAVLNGYGSVDYLTIKEMEKPVVKKDQVLIKTKATGINAGDLFCLKGNPWLVKLSLGIPKPKDYVLGWDISGVVEAVGSQVTRFKPGDEVWGCGDNTFKEWVTVKEKHLYHKPENISFEEAGAMGTAAITALCGLKAGKLQTGQSILINGASGGVGSFAVQIAKAMGATVTAVCSGKNRDLVLELGADKVVDYTKDDFTQHDDRYDVILDNVSSRTIADLKKVLKPTGVIVPNSGFGGMSYVFKVGLLSIFSKKISGMFMANTNEENLKYLTDLVTEGKLKTSIDQSFPFNDIRSAFKHLDEKHAKGKLVILF